MKTLPQDESVALTIYNQNFGVVRKKRNVDVPARVGTSEQVVTDTVRNTWECG